MFVQGNFRTAASHTISRESLRPRRRPYGQCTPCFKAGLPHTVSLNFCLVCKAKQEANSNSK